MEIGSRRPCQKRLADVQAKLSWARDQELGNPAVDLIGLDAPGADDYWADNLLAVRQASIAGGTTEINKNIVGEHVLGLPR